MKPQDPLANLQPLREPELVSWWPPAPGWWLLFALATALVAALAYLLVSNYRRNTYRRRGLLQLQALEQEFQANADTGHLVTQTNALLKSVALAAYPRHEVASRHGADWAAFLNSKLKAGAPFSEEFTAAVYQQNAAPVDAAQLVDAARHWIKRHRVAT